ncbi:MAG: bifunctional phosphoglucose/phosphomannose isomerase [Solirubrobacteraceae bacterium]
MQLDAEAVNALDGAGQIADTLTIADQLGDALWRVESAGLRLADTPGGIVVAGMGGSGIGGLLARSALGDQASRPILVARGYGLPPWTTPQTTVLCVSYSGETEETCACFEAAGALGAQRVVASTGGRLASLARAEQVPVIPLPGGFQSRSAVVYATICALEVAARCGAGPRLTPEIDVAAEHLRRLAQQWGPDGPEDGEAKTLARSLIGTVPLIAGAGLSAPIAYRWKSQINVNAKLHAFAHVLPELDHNELAGWEGASHVAPFSVVFLEDCDSHPRIQERMRLTREIVAASGCSTHLARSRGDSAIERVLSLVLLGDLVSLYMAFLRGVDPTPVEAIDGVKRALARPE